MADRERELRTIFAGLEEADNIYRREIDVERLPEDEAYLKSKGKKKTASSKKK